MIVSTADHFQAVRKQHTWEADHSILLAQRPNALSRFCGYAIVPSVLVFLGHFGEVCIQLRDFQSATTIACHRKRRYLTAELSL